MQLAIRKFYFCKKFKVVTLFLFRWELTQAKDVTKAKLPVGKNSVKGVGKTEPDPNDIYITEDGVKVPYGKETKSKAKKSSLLYNEYVVYDVDQVNIKYLLMVKFKHLKTDLN